MNDFKKPDDPKRKPGYDKKYSDQSFIDALTKELQTTAQIRRKIGCSHDTASRTLKRLADEGITKEGSQIYHVEMMSIEAGSGTGKMNLWKKKKV